MTPYLLLEQFLLLTNSSLVHVSLSHMALLTREWTFLSPYSSRYLIRERYRAMSVNHAWNYSVNSNTRLTLSSLGSSSQPLRRWCMACVLCFKLQHPLALHFTRQIFSSNHASNIRAAGSGPPILLCCINKHWDVWILVLSLIQCFSANWKQRKKLWNFIHSHSQLMLESQVLPPRWLTMTSDSCSLSVDWSLFNCWDLLSNKAQFIKGLFLVNSCFPRFYSTHFNFTYPL